MFNKLTAHYYGTPTPLNQLASFHLPEARMVIVQPYDKSSLGAIERAIRDSDLGVNPTNDGAVIRVVFPELTEERRKEYIKVARHKAEEGRVSIRSIRRHAKDALDRLVKNGEAGEDEVRRAETSSRSSPVPTSTRSTTFQDQGIRTPRSLGGPRSQPGAAAADPGPPAILKPGALPDPEPPRRPCRPGTARSPGACGLAEPAAKPPRSGRNLPVAAGVGTVLGGIVVLRLFTVKATFLILMAAAAVVALWELARSLGSKDIHAPLLPVAAGGAAMWVCEYWWSDGAVLASLVLTVVVILAWRLPGDTDGYLRDVAAGVFVLAYVPPLAVFMVAMLAPADGARRVLLFVVLTICSDIGGYFAGQPAGRTRWPPSSARTRPGRIGRWSWPASRRAPGCSPRCCTATSCRAS